MKLWKTVAELLRAHCKCAMITIVEAKGSSPREPGARLLVTENGCYRGTIGGGALEWRAMARAQAALSSGGSTVSLTTAVLGPDLGQCCGGQVKLLTEILTLSDLVWIEDFAAREAAGSFSTVMALGPSPGMRVLADVPGVPGSAHLASGNVLRETFGEDRRKILLFGAGHVGRALVLALSPLPFAVTWIDQRPEAFLSAVPANVDLRLMQNPVAALDLSPSGSFAVVMTHSHALDFDIVFAALHAGSFPYVGLIGSDTKRARFSSRLRAAGIEEAALRTLVCPIGMNGISSKQPAVIAASVVAELLARDEELRALAHPVTATLQIA